MPELPPSLLLGNGDEEGPPPKEFEQYVHWRFHQLGNSTHKTSMHMVLQTQILEGQAKVQETQAKLIERLSIDIAGDGNGRPGIKAELKDIKRWQAEHDQSAQQRAAELKEKAENTRKLYMWGLGVLGSIVATLITTSVAQYRQAKATRENQEIMSRQIQQLPGAKPGPVVKEP